MPNGRRLTLEDLDAKMERRFDALSEDIITLGLDFHAERARTHRALGQIRRSIRILNLKVDRGFREQGRRLKFIEEDHGRRLKHIEEDHGRRLKHIEEDHGFRLARIEKTLKISERNGRANGEHKP